MLLFEDLSVKSVGKLDLGSLDYIGYVVVLPQLNADMARYAAGEINIQELKALLQMQQLEQP